MSQIDVPVKYCLHYRDLPKPEYQTQGSAGIDLLAANEEDMIIKPGEIVLVPTGICLELPSAYEAQVRPRSGLALRHGVTVLNSPGTIDSDYRGEIQVILINLGKEDFVIKRGMRIAQMVVARVNRIKLEEQEKINETKRNAGGFGHTGI